MPETSTSTVSPGCMGPHRRGAGGDHVPRLQGHGGGDERDERPHTSDELLCPPLLHHLTVQSGGDGQVFRVHLVGDDRPHGGKAIHIFAAGPLAVRLLDIPGGDIVEAGVAQHIVQRLLLRHILGTPLHYHGQLSLVIQPPYKVWGVNRPQVGVEGVGGP